MSIADAADAVSLFWSDRYLRNMERTAVLRDKAKASSGYFEKPFGRHDPTNMSEQFSKGTRAKQGYHHPA